MFDQAYYNRFYEDPDTRVSTPAATRRLATFVLSYLDHICIDVKTCLDVGAGLGWWRRTLHAHNIQHHGLEVSEYLHRTKGWELGSITEPANRKADLVVCQGVLGYIPDQDLQASINNLIKWTSKALYLSVACTEDVGRSINKDKSDDSMIYRPSAVYMSMLRRDMISIGGGLFLPIEDANHRMTAMESPRR